MSDRAFVDTNVLVYAHDRSAGIKHEKARELVTGLWEDRCGVISTQVLQELYVNVRRKADRPLGLPQARRLIEDYLAWEVVVNTGEAILQTLDIERRFQLSFWDALIVHAAATADVGTLYSEELNDGQVYGTVRVVNPLRS